MIWKLNWLGRWIVRALVLVGQILLTPFLIVIKMKHTFLILLLKMLLKIQNQQLLRAVTIQQINLVLIHMHNQNKKLSRNHYHYLL
ncbi:hypothetical protein XBKB1_870008 [Xenorhabdus bovienii str. kraussei Becker Underwood]|uniref:Uncharacterized protein n=1 Tax=Xenorhabdus bovienii str. kraussei Becker Underwood TaxID=1398204 RepID=A0A077Q0Y1_XENBV|nr:hypothetical protein XBKB1_870008 [Xenorhabdus bovienii str. kraussei Becker Underwood]